MMNAKVVFGARILLGLIFAVFGANGLMMTLTGNGFIPMPPPPPEVLAKMQGFFTLGYLLPLVKVLEIAAGVMLLSGRFVNLALVFLGPIIVNILCVHIFIDMSGLPMALLVTALFGVILCSRWPDFKLLLKV